jgi:hypothetical protein
MPSLLDRISQLPVQCGVSIWSTGQPKTRIVGFFFFLRNEVATKEFQIQQYTGSSPNIREKLRHRNYHHIRPIALHKNLFSISRKAVIPNSKIARQDLGWGRRSFSTVVHHSTIRATPTVWQIN